MRDAHIAYRASESYGTLKSSSGQLNFSGECGPERDMTGPRIGCGNMMKLDLGLSPILY